MFLWGGDFNFPDIYWKYNTEERIQSRRLPDCVEDSFLTQMVSEPAKEGAPLVLLFARREALVSEGLLETAIMKGSLMK